MLKRKNRLFLAETVLALVFVTLAGVRLFMPAAWGDFLGTVRIGPWHPVFGPRIAWAKLRGRAPECPWQSLLATPIAHGRILRRKEHIEKRMRVLETDDSLGVVKIDTPHGEYWIPERGEHLDGFQLLAYLIADHTLLAESYPAHTVRPGDVVIDCGAHVGVFSALALELGAAKVLSVEPDPVARECLQRNLAAEIEAGRVIIISEGVWSEDTTLDLVKSPQNSGASSAVFPLPGAKASIEVTTLDRLVSQTSLSRVDFIKMDIEGAEREALAGAHKTLVRLRPRLMLDSNHRPDDLPVFRSILSDTAAGYEYLCTYCEPNSEQTLVPHLTFCESR